MDEDSFPNTTRPDHDSAKGYALSGKIMLSAIIVLFAVVVIMVFLHIYARWYLIRARRRQYRRGRRRTHFVFYVEPTNPASIAATYPPRGLDANVLKSLPTFTYSAKTDDGESLECAVCLSEFEDNEKGRLLPKCNHSFHLDCIDMWFHSHSTCPLCRSPVDSDFCFPIKGDGDHQNGSTAATAAAEEERDVVVNIGELTQRVPNTSYDLCQTSDDDLTGGRPGPSIGFGSSSSFAGRRKGADFVGVEIEVPRRCISFSCSNNSDGLRLSSPGGSGQTMKSPTSRLLSLKRILSREKKSPLPSPSSGVGTSRRSGCDSDVELGRLETQPLSPAQTPR